MFSDRYFWLSVYARQAEVPDFGSSLRGIGFSGSLRAVTGVQYAVQSVDFSKLYPVGTIEDLSLDQFRKQLENLQCCVTSKTGKANGDPLNLVVVGNGVDAILPFIMRGDCV